MYSPTDQARLPPLSGRVERQYTAANMNRQIARWAGGSNSSTLLALCSDSN